jgi:hypothetical protein
MPLRVQVAIAVVAVTAWCAFAGGVDRLSGVRKTVRVNGLNLS